jgi:hypothetical protein
MRIRLPNFDQRIGYEQAIAIENTSSDTNALTNGLWLY